MVVGFHFAVFAKVWWSWIEALFKMNRFHWHLSDDQGWRIPSEKYPKLEKAKVLAKVMEVFVLPWWVCIYLFVYLFICLFICFFGYLFICLLIHPSVCLFVCLLPQQVIFFFQIRAFHLDRWELGGKALRSGTPRTMTMYDMEAGHFPSAKPVGCDMRFFFWGSYTRDEMRDIVSYAKSLYIEIIPEIDSPGHIQAEMLRFFSAFCFIFFHSSSWIWPLFCKLSSFSYLLACFFSGYSILRPSWLLTLSWGTTGTPTPRWQRSSVPWLSRDATESPCWRVSSCSCWGALEDVLSPSARSLRFVSEATWALDKTFDLTWLVFSKKILTLEQLATNLNALNAFGTETGPAFALISDHSEVIGETAQLVDSDYFHVSWRTRNVWMHQTTRFWVKGIYDISICFRNFHIFRESLPRLEVMKWPQGNGRALPWPGILWLLITSAVWKASPVSWRRTHLGAGTCINFSRLVQVRMIMNFTELGNLDKIVAKQFVISCGMVLMLKSIWYALSIQDIQSPLKLLHQRRFTQSMAWADEQWCGMMRCWDQRSSAMCESSTSQTF